METLNEVNELLTTKMCSPVIIYGIILLMSLICIYFTRQRLGRYSTLKMENLYNLYSAQELKFLLVLGATMYGLCQYNKTELAWIFLIFPVIYIMLQNVLLYVHVSSALQNAPQEQPQMAASYGSGMQAPLLSGQGPSPPQISMPETPPPQPTQPQQEFTLPKMTNQSNSLGNGFGSMMGGDPSPSGYSF
jgi:hypothetical protein